MRDTRAVIEELFEEARAFFKYPQVTLDVGFNQPAPFCIQNGRVMFDLKVSEGLKTEQLRDIMLHELAHYCVFPRYYKWAVGSWEATLAGFTEELEAQEKCGKQVPYEWAESPERVLLDVRNIFADVVVNQYLEEQGVAIHKTHVSLLQDGKDAKYDQHPIPQLFYAATNYSLGQDVIPVTYPLAKKYAERMVDSLNALRPLETRYRELGGHLAQYLLEAKGSQYEQPQKPQEGGDGEGGQEGANTRDDQKSGQNGGSGGQDGSQGEGEEAQGGQEGQGDQAETTQTKTAELTTREIQEVARELAKRLQEDRATPTQDMDGDENRQEEALEELTPEQLKKLRGRQAGHGSASVRGLSDARYYRLQAKKNIRFKAQVMANKGGHSGNGGLIPWGVGDSPESLQVGETVTAGGVLIPGVNTVQFEPKVGGSDPILSHPAVQIILDTSGSMPQDVAIMTCFSLIEAARLNNVAVSAVLYTSMTWFDSGFTFNYNQLEEDIVAQYTSGGTDSWDGVSHALPHLEGHQDKALVIWVTDLQDNYRRLHNCFNGLSEAEQRGHLVALLHIDGKWTDTDLEYIERCEANREDCQDGGPVIASGYRRTLAANPKKLKDLEGLVIGQLNTYMN